MIASLPMYDRPELAAAHDALWAATRDTLRSDGQAAPDDLNREIGIWEGWRAADLLLGQTCGLPYRATLHDNVTMIGSFDYGLNDAPAGYYLSHVVTRRGESGTLSDYANRRLAINGYDSHSGWAGIATMAKEAGFAFKSVHVTGAHTRSARAIAEGGADIAAIDAITWRALERFDPELANAVQIIGQTAPSPGMALITALGRNPSPLRRALDVGLHALPSRHRAALGICGVVDIPKAAYLAEATPEPAEIPV